MAFQIHAATTIPVIMGILALMGLGFSLFSSPNTTAIMGSVTPRHYGIASGFMATMRTLGMLGCMTVITLIFHYFMGDQPVNDQTRNAFLKSMHVSMIIFCGLCVVGVFFSMGRLKIKTVSLKQR